MYKSCVHNSLSFAGVFAQLLQKCPESHLSWQLIDKYFSGSLISLCLWTCYNKVLIDSCFLCFMKIMFKNYKLSMTYMWNSLLYMNFWCTNSCVGSFFTLSCQCLKQTVLREKKVWILQCLVPIFVWAMSSCKTSGFFSSFFHLL